MNYMIKINVVKTTNERTKVRAFASVVFGNSFKVTNISIMENSKNGELFVSMPRYCGSDLGEDGQPIYKDVCNPITREFREELYKNILTAYEKAVNDRVDVMTVGAEDNVPEPKFSVRMHALDREGSNVRAVGQVYIEDSFIINNVNVIEGKKGLFVTMPSYKTKRVDEDGKAIYQDICYPVTKDFRDKLFGEILDGYNAERDKAFTVIGDSRENSTPVKDVNETKVEANTAKGESKNETSESKNEAKADSVDSDKESDKQKSETTPVKKGRKK